MAGVSGVSGVSGVVGVSGESEVVGVSEVTGVSRVSRVGVAGVSGVAAKEQECTIGVLNCDRQLTWYAMYSHIFTVASTAIRLETVAALQEPSLLPKTPNMLYELYTRHMSSGVGVWSDYIEWYVTQKLIVISAKA